MTGTGYELKGPHFVLSVEGEIHGEDTPANRELVRRIHACVGACEGISTDELEQGVVQDMRRVIGQVVPLLQTRVQSPIATSAAKPPIMLSDPRAALRTMQDAC